MSNEIYELQPSIQHYAWGGLNFIPDWLGLAQNGRPYAEAWYGAHPAYPSTIIVDGQPIKLTDWIGSNPGLVLGEESLPEYGSRLPFLLKILDIKDMLSIQLHPDKKGAEVGFKDENNRGIALNALHRNYKDDNHKPELLIALSDFWMLQGFEDLKVIYTRMQILIPGFKDRVNELSWRNLINEIWSLPEEIKNEYGAQLQANLDRINLEDKNDIGYWLKKALETYPPNAGNFDRGLLVMLMLHVQYLKPGESGYQAPGVLHAYLEGQNVELMSNSDNVLRGGLTPKHIDDEELLKHLNTDQPGQCLLQPIYLMDDEKVYSPPVKDFMIKQFKIKRNTKKLIQFPTASIMLLQKGELDSSVGIKLADGKSWFIPAYNMLEVTALTDETEFFVATNTF